MIVFLANPCPGHRQLSRIGELQYGHCAANLSSSGCEGFEVRVIHALPEDFAPSAHDQATKPKHVGGCQNYGPFLGP